MFPYVLCGCTINAETKIETNTEREKQRLENQFESQKSMQQIETNGWKTQ